MGRENPFDNSKRNWIGTRNIGRLFLSFFAAALQNNYFFMAESESFYERRPVEEKEKK